MRKKKLVTKLTRSQMRKMAERSRAWMNTPEGKAAMKEAAERGTPIADRLREACRPLSAEELMKPIGACA